jgi:hypothetical protein
MRFCICLKCDLRTCIQTRTGQCIDLTNRQNLAISQCIKNQVQPIVNQICPISDCLEWRVAHWHGVSWYEQSEFLRKYFILVSS